MLKNLFSRFFLFLLSAFCYLESAEPPSLTPVVLVSIAPYKFFVEQIAQGTVSVNLMVPTGVSPHAYEPNARAILNASQAAIWFLMGEPFEQRAIQALRSYSPEIRLVDLRKGINLIHEAGEAHCNHDGCGDPHIWLSPREAKKQTTLIAQELSAAFPAHKEEYKTNLLALHQKLDKLDSELTTLFRSAPFRTVMVAHGAYAYLCRDYGLIQLPIEFEGREPSPQQLTQVLDQARAKGIKTVFTQPQHLSKGARLVAKELGAKVVELDPYSENYFENLRQIASHFASQTRNTPKVAILGNVERQLSW